MSKGIKFKDNTYLDSSGIVHSRKLLSTLLNGIKPVSLLNTPLQSSSTIATNTVATLNQNYTEYDAILCRVGVGVNAVEGRWELLLPKILGEQTQWNIYIYAAYKCDGKISLANSNQVILNVQEITGWPNNNIYISKVYGIKLQ